MLLTPTELERLTIYTAAELARKHRAKGLKLNYPEARRPDRGRDPRGRPRGPPGRRADRLRLDDPDHRRRAARRRRDDAHDPGRGRCSRTGTKLVTVHEPIRPGDAPVEAGPAPGAIRAAAEATSSSTPAGRRPRADRANTGDRPVQVGSPFPLLRGQPGARLRSQRGVRHAARHPGRHRGPLRAGREPERDAGAPSAARRELVGLNALTDECALDGWQAGGARTGPRPPASRGPEGMAGCSRARLRRAVSARPRATASGSATPTVGRGRAGPRRAGRRVRASAAARRCATAWARTAASTRADGRARLS